MEELVPVSLLTNLKYASWELPGAQQLAWLQPQCLERLAVADKLVRQREEGAQIVVWDALRSIDTQRFIYETERTKYAVTHPALGSDEVDEAVSQFVRPPLLDLPPPHATGGAVDVTLYVAGTDTLLGDFDDFSTRGRADYYANFPPEDDLAKQQAYLRFVLAESMKEAGFVGIPEEWWHWEFGTRLWAEIKKEPVRFNSVLRAPTGETLSARLPLMPSRLFVDVHGVAQVFPNSGDRADALGGATSGYYYARTRHHNERQASALLCELIGAEDAVLLPSGLCAAWVAVASHMEAGQTAVVDKFVYYETRRVLQEISAREGWAIVFADLSAATDVKHALTLKPRVLFVDHPRNWYLSTPDLFSIRSVFAKSGTKVIVDLSVQPLQAMLTRGLADLVVISLSKYPAQGETLGGAIAGEIDALRGVRRYVGLLGLAMSPEAAETIASHTFSLRDRIKAISEKAHDIVAYLRKREEIEDVFFPDLSAFDAAPGGQLTIRFKSAEVAAAVEAVVAWNSSSRSFPLSLACTFGAAFTTLEHFVGRGSREQQERDGSSELGDRLMRIGVGHEEGQAILAALTFALNTASANLREKCERLSTSQSDRLVSNLG